MQGALNSEQLLAETEKDEGQQGWLATFADLMSLLMCFFVLLLSFSELDVIKFQQIAGSMKVAFGVQRDIKAESPPLGTSFVAQEFSPATAEPTPIEQIFQPRQEEQQPALKVGETNDERQQDRLKSQLQDVLADELQQGQFELDAHGQQLVIRIPENSSFASASAYLQPQYRPVLQRMAALLAEIPGRITVAGHTDDRPLAGELYADNLELSAQRAMAVARVLRSQSLLMNVHVEAWGDAQPLADNNTRQNRARNRRVEIRIHQGQAQTASLPSQLFSGE